MSPWYALEFTLTLIIVMFLTVTGYQAISPHKPCFCVMENAQNAR